MANPNPANPNPDRRAYHKTLVERAGRVDERMRKSLLAWASICEPGSGSSASERSRVSLGRALDDLRDRLIPLTPDPVPPVIEHNGFVIHDRPLAAVDLSSSVILPTGAVFCDGRLFAQDFRYCPIKWHDIGWYMPEEDIGFKDYDIRDNTCIADVSSLSGLETLPETEAYFLFVSNYSGRNIAHFTIDTLGQLLAYNELCELKGRKLVPILSEPLQIPMQKFLFEKLVAPLERIVYLPAEPVRVKTCYSALKACVGLHEIAIGAYRYLHGKIRELKAAEHASGVLTLPRIYVSRSDATGSGRNFSNLPELEQLLRDRFFSSVVVSRLTPREMLRVFDGCSIIAGIHGAGLLNAFFTDSKARIVEFSDHPVSPERIPAVLLAAGFDCLRLPAIPPTPDSGGLPAIDLRRGAEAIA
jgi:hypothetical protein